MKKIQISTQIFTLVVSIFILTFTPNGLNSQTQILAHGAGWQTFNLPTPGPAPWPYSAYTGQPANWNNSACTTCPTWPTNSTTGFAMWVPEPTGNIYGALFRNTFNISGTPVGSYYITVQPNNECEVFINGIKVFSRRKPNGIFNLNPGPETVCVPLSFLQSGQNLVAIQATEWTDNTTNLRFQLFHDSSTNVCPPDSTVYCCDNSYNFITNGNFENGNTGFTSNYSFNTNPFPGEYYVGTRSDALAISPQWIVEDHSKCINGSTLNNNFMMVNGKTQQSPGTESVIWEQGINIPPTNPNDPFEEKKYRVCVNFKNLPQCAFDILPEVEIRINGQLSGYRTINTSPSQCDWQLESMIVSLGSSASYIMEIVLKEDGNGDGNDLAIDDISLQELQEANINISTLYDGSTQTATASIYSLTNADDAIPCEDAGYFWYVGEITNHSPLAWDPTTFGLGDAVFSNSAPFGFGPAWNLTTNFPNYNFQNGIEYMIGLYLPENEECCQSETFVWQPVGEFERSEQLSQLVLSEEMKSQIREAYYIHQKSESLNTTESNNIKTKLKENKLGVYPNPANNILNITTKNITAKLYTIVDNAGKEVYNSSEITNSISIENLVSGSYLLKVIDESGKIHSARFIKL